MKHVDVNVEKYGVWHHYEAEAFAGIYPRRIGVVSSVRKEETKDEEGNPFTIWYFKDDSLDFDPNNYELANQVKRVSFQEGSKLAGLGDEADGTYYFEVNFNSDTRNLKSSPSGLMTTTHNCPTTHCAPRKMTNISFGISA